MKRAEGVIKPLSAIMSVIFIHFIIKDSETERI